MKLTALLAAFAIAALAACSPMTLKTTFNANEAAFINTKGKATITGQAFLRRNDGVVVYAAGSEVYLMPKTTYSDERMTSIYKGAKVSYFGGTFKNDDPNYYTYSRKTIADGEGRFSFTEVADGSYYIVTEVVWMVQYARQGGAMMERVTVAGGQFVQVIMSGQ